MEAPKDRHGIQENQDIKRKADACDGNGERGVVNSEIRVDGIPGARDGMGRKKLGLIQMVGEMVSSLACLLLGPSLLLELFVARYGQIAIFIKGLTKTVDTAHTTRRAFVA